ncbi:hypothetical protein SASPL_150715 [Salvia splendens]|uniref:EGF-like domain-containing protein n=1 Tax=Salvia splendens TaxID=180675 RepID=A0A8X8W6H7_SALSN|nr:hypothetical protein SASPL_150715 [Salvia splendens]
MLAMASTLATQNFPVAKPNCIDTCGDIRIPFPFGTTPECYLDREFGVTCNHSTSKLFWMDTTVELTDLSLDGHLKLLQFIAKNCYKNGKSSRSNGPSLQLTKYFTVSNTANKFTIVGCDAYGYVSGNRLKRRFTTGCTAMCSSLDDLTEGECAGAGCCQTIIPDDVWNLDIEVGSHFNYTRISNFSNCSYAFFVEDNAFKFSKANLTNLSDVTKLPTVVDWSIGNETCEKVTGNACLSANSHCHNPKNGNGYNCRCSDGFEGNPYLTNGCRDIDECTDKIHKCTKSEYCYNTQGSYTCSCPKNYDGDGRGDYGCSKKQNIKIASISIVVAGGIIALLLAIILLYLELKRRSQRKTKLKFFLQNGGHMLQEKLARREASPEMITIFSSSKLQMATNNFHSRKHSWARDAVDIEEEAVSLLPIDYNGMSGVSSSSGYGSICRDHIVLPIYGGR